MLNRMRTEEERATGPFSLINHFYLASQQMVLPPVRIVVSILQHVTSTYHRFFFPPILRKKLRDILVSVSLLTLSRLAAFFFFF
jgi:hypothetical protein